MGFSREIPALPSPGTPVNVAQLKLSAYQAARIKVTVVGQYSGYGGYICVADRALVANGSGTITATTIGTDFQNSAPVTIGFSVGTNDICTVTLTTGAGISAAISGNGDIKFEISGNPYQITRS
jgi:hypothetical protein